MTGSKSAVPDPNDGPLRELAEKFPDFVKVAAEHEQTDFTGQPSQQEGNGAARPKEETEIIASQQRYAENVGSRERAKNSIVAEVPDENGLSLEENITRRLYKGAS